MTNEEQVNRFEDIETIVSAPLNFTAKLAIGEDAYTALRVKNTMAQVWDVAGVVTTFSPRPDFSQHSESAPR